MRNQNTILLEKLLCFVYRPFTYNPGCNPSRFDYEEIDPSLSLLLIL